MIAIINYPLQVQQDGHRKNTFVFWAMVFDFRYSENPSRESSEPFSKMLSFDDDKPNNDAVKNCLGIDGDNIRLSFYSSEESKASFRDIYDLYLFDKKLFASSSSSPQRFGVIEIRSIKAESEIAAIKKEQRWKEANKRNAEAFSEHTKRLDSYLEQLEKVEKIRKMVAADVDSNLTIHKEKLRKAINELEPTLAESPDFDKLKTVKELDDYIDKFIKVTDIKKELLDQNKIRSAEELVDHAQILHCLVLKPDVVSGDGAIHSPSKALNWKEDADLSDIMQPVVAGEASLSYRSDVMEYEKCEKRVANMKSLGTDAGMKGSMGGLAFGEIGLGMFSAAVERYTSKKEEDISSTSTTSISKREVKYQLNKHRKQEIRIRPELLCIATEPFLELNNIGKLTDQNLKEERLKEWMVLYGTHVSLRATFGVVQILYAISTFTGSHSMENKERMLGESLDQRFSASAVFVGAFLIAKAEGAYQEQKDSAEKEMSSTAQHKEKQRIEVTDAIFSNGLSNGLSDMQLKLLIDNGNQYWTVIERPYGSNDCKGIWEIIKISHKSSFDSDKEKSEEIARNLADLMEFVWARDILEINKLTNVKELGNFKSKTNNSKLKEYLGDLVGDVGKKRLVK